MKYLLNEVGLILCVFYCISVNDLAKNKKSFIIYNNKISITDSTIYRVYYYYYY